MNCLRWILLMTLWLGAIALGVDRMLRYETLAGEVRSPLHTRPQEFCFGNQGSTIVVFVHPKCPCTKASLIELEDLCKTAKGAALAIVLFEPKEADFDWHCQGESLHTQFPFAHLIRDTDNELAHRFGATTSGQCFVYAPTGELKFAGGITIARGHEGDNPNLEAAKKAVFVDSSTVATAPVFGCPLEREHCSSK